MEKLVTVGVPDPCGAPLSLPAPTPAVSVGSGGTLRVQRSGLGGGRPCPCKREQVATDTCPYGDRSCSLLRMRDLRAADGTAVSSAGQYWTLENVDPLFQRWEQPLLSLGSFQLGLQPLVTRRGRSDTPFGHFKPVLPPFSLSIPSLNRC